MQNFDISIILEQQQKLTQINPNLVSNGQNLIKHQHIENSNKHSILSVDFRKILTSAFPIFFELNNECLFKNKKVRAIILRIYFF